MAQLNPHLAQEAVQCFSNNSEASPSYERKKSETVRSSRDFFQMNNEAAVVRPLAMQMGYIPADVDVFALTEIERKHLSEQPSNNEFLKDAFWCVNGNHFVRGTQAPFPVIGPSCKYIALFDDRPEFDALRLSFLISADPEQLLHTFVTKLQSLVQESIEALSAQQIQICLTFLHTSSNWKNLRAPVQEPPNFASRAWPAYLACLRNRNYYFSVAEIVVIAAGVGRNVAIFKTTNGDLSYEAGYFRGRGPVIVIKLETDTR